MSRLKQFAENYLTFTRKERIGILVIVIAVAGIWLVPKVFQSENHPAKASTDTTWMAAVKKIQHKEKSKQPDQYNDDKVEQYVYEKPVNISSENVKAELFYFDPNSLSTEGWKKLGIKDKTIHTIQNYLAKGGRFYKPEDLKKIYGLRTEDFNRLQPYIRIETSEKTLVVNTNSENHYKESKPINKPTFIDINTADTTAFIALPGIGNKLASRIVNFREKLGGFYSINQIAETYGLPDSTFQKIKSFLSLKNTEIKKFNINTATKDEMKVHPYIKWNLANAIVEYRNQHGNYSSLEDLKKITLITDEIFNKIKAYLTL